MKVVKQFCLITIFSHVFWIFGLTQVINTRIDAGNRHNSNIVKNKITEKHCYSNLVVNSDNTGMPYHYNKWENFPMLKNIHRYDETTDKNFSLVKNISEERESVSPELEEIFLEFYENELPISSTWGDYDNDGYLEILLSIFNENTDESFCLIYKYDGDYSFSEQLYFDISLNKPTAGWFDYNKDNNLDVFLYPFEGPFETIDIYENEGLVPSFQKKDSIIINMRVVALKSADFDRDGDLDLVMIVYSDDEFYDNSLCKIFWNIDNHFHDSNISLKGADCIGIADYNKDNYPDILLAGVDVNGNSHSTLYKNIGGINFQEQKNILLADVMGASVAWGDYDSDGDPDILLSGATDSYEKISKIYKNEGNNTFTEQSDIELIGVSSGHCHWGDYDNDGDLDILLSGYSEIGAVSVIYENEGFNVFNQQTDDEELLGVSNLTPSSSEWGDFDADGDLDILISDDYNVVLYRNNSLINNQKPDEPINLHHKITGNQVKLNWDPSNDAETPSQSLTYNVRVGTLPGACDIVTPMADIASGIRKIPGEGNSYLNTEFIINNLDTGIYYWSVQSVDNGFLGSDFSEEQSFTVVPLFTKQSNISLMGLDGSDADWGDFDNDGDLDILFDGESFGEGSFHITKIYKNEGNRTFTEHTDISSIVYSNSSIDWGDYDHDGDLDILICSDSIAPQSSSTYLTPYIVRVFRNDDNNEFIELTDNYLIGSFEGSDAVWGDYDNDGDLDILAAGRLPGCAKIFKNMGDEIFTDINARLNHVNGKIAWGDYDNDGDLDIVSVNYNLSTIYRNNGDETFTEIDAGLTDVAYSSVNWNDYDNDGDLDILLTGLFNNYGETDYGKHVTDLYRNDRNDTFTSIETQIRKISHGSSQWGDYDNDGFIDIGLTGLSGAFITKVYHNNQNETFTEVNVLLNPLYDGSFNWGDYDNDGDLDILLTGTRSIIGESEGYTEVYNNNTNYPNELPTAPENLNSELFGFNMRLSWNKAMDPDCPQGSMSYNLRIGTIPEGIDIMAPMSDLNTGKRNIPAIGNAQCDTFWIIKGIVPNKKYFWSVQAIDQSFTGGPWASVDSFIVTEVSPDFAFDTVCRGSQTFFTDLSETTDTIIAWKWFFGDDSISVLQNPSHLYQTSDTFNVTLWAFTQSGDSAGRTRQVIVKMSPSASFIADTICTGIKTTFTSTSNHNGLVITSWQWDFGDNDKSTSEGLVQHLYAAHGSYNVQLTLTAENGCANSFSDTVLVGEVPAPVITYSYGGNIFCEGDSAIIQAVQIPQSTFAYKWYHNGDLQTNTMNSYTVLTAGEYKAEVTNTSGNCTTGSIPVIISIYENLDTVIIKLMDYDSNACSGTQEVTLTAEPKSELYQYRWYYNNALVAGAYSAQYTDYLKEGSYSVNVGSGQCEISSQPINLSFKLMLPKPQIYTMGPVVWILACSNDTVSEYKWYYNGTLLPEARKPLYVANKQTGYYYVRISDGNGCYTSSDTILIGDANKDAFNDADETIILYPNPNDGTFNLYYQSNLTGIINLEIYNVLGELVYSDQYSKNENPLLENINLKGLSAGYYTIQVKIDNNLIIRHLIIKDN
jgi:PKD repeat protein